MNCDRWRGSSRLYASRVAGCLVGLKCERQGCALTIPRLSHVIAIISPLHPQQSTNRTAKLLRFKHEKHSLNEMASQISDKDLGDAIIQSIEHGSFPQDEHVASAPVPATALPKLLEVVGKAREETKVGHV